MERIKLGFMDGAIHSESEDERPLVRTGPIELRDLGPNGRPLGTHDDIYEDSPWELHRGELVERPMAHDIDALAITIAGTLFSTHARAGYTALTDIDCVLDDEFGESLRIPDAALVHELKEVKGAAFQGIPVIAVEVRATQRKKHLEEKVKLYLEHDWPTIWLVHADRREVEVVQKGLASVTYRPGSSVPMPPELDKYGLSSFPTNAFFDQTESSKYIDQWVEGKGRERGRADGVAAGINQSLLAALGVRGLDVPSAIRERIAACGDVDTLQRWLTFALTAPNVEAFIAGLD